MDLFNKMNGAVAAVTATLATLATGAAVAQTAPEGLEIIGAPEAGGTGFQPAATGLAEQIHFLDNLLLWISAIIVVFVCGLLAWVILRHNARSNPTPASFSHNTPIEVTWTLVPLAILVFIGAFSLPVLFNQQEIPEGDVVIKATGNQWNWSYEYPGTDIEFSSFMLQRDELEEYGYSQDEYRLATDTAVVVPTGQDIVVQVTASDVIHSWTIPAFGVKQDGVPGRLAELWFNVEPGMEGIYFGQCSELCGLDHAFMPITVMAVTPEEYEAWLGTGGTDFAGAFIGGNRELPQTPGIMQCRLLGCAVEAFDEQGRAVIGEVGELVCTEPLPSMPLRFWNDPGNARYLSSYFETYPDNFDGSGRGPVWRHGDWLKIEPDGSCVIYGRSDATINRHGLRMGTSELYSAIEALPEVLDSMVVDLEYLGRDSYMPLFVVLREGVVFDAAMKARINQAVEAGLSRRFLPNDIFVVAEIPRTLSGKKQELPVKKLLLGHPVEKVINRDAMANPGCLDWYLDFARSYLSKQAGAA